MDIENFIETSIKKIRQASDNNKLVVFVGAGVSANSNLPSWSLLIKEFADELGVKYESDNNSIDYYLKIPQYYYLERGQKEYYDLIDRKINSVQGRPNDINRIIFELNPSTIITTNFDELLEMTVKEQGLFYTTIKQDKDLPYCINDKLIIKMHGDGNLKNIVLKEDDYLNYSSKFPLIENYIKGLFSTKTVLFVGYSAEDPDFKLIFNLVKGQLGGDFQPAYLLDINKQNERLEFNYYKNRGINILYYSDISRKIDSSAMLSSKTDIKNEFGEKLYKFLLYIKNKNEDYEDKFEEIYNKLKIFEGMNSIYPNDISKVLGAYGYDLYGLKELFIQKSEFMLENYKIIMGEDEEAIKALFSNKYVEKILQLLNRASISKIMIGSIETVINLEKYIDSKSCEEQEDTNELLSRFKYNELTDYIKSYNNIEDVHGIENDVLKIAFIMYNLGEYVDAYYILKKLSSHSYASGKYYHYFIAQVNLKHLHRLLVNDNKYSKLKNHNDIEIELDSINIREKYMSLPKSVKDKCSFILEIENFNVFYKETISMSNNFKKLKHEKEVVENGGHSVTDNLRKSLNRCNVINNYIEKNFLMVQHFLEIRNFYEGFIQGILVNYSVKCKDTKNNFSGIGNKIDTLDSGILEIIIRFIKREDLKVLLKEFDINEIKVDENTIIYLIDCLDNIISINSEKNSSSVLDKSNSLNNILILLRYINLDKEQVKYIVELVENSLIKNVFDGTNFDEIFNFIFNKFNRNREQIDAKCILSFVEEYIKLLINNNLNGYAILLISSKKFFENITYIIKEIDSELKISIDKELEILINSVIKNRNDDIINNLLLELYNIMNEKNQLLFKEFIIKYAEDFKESNEYRYITLINDLIKKGIIEDEKLYIKFLIYCFEYTTKQAKVEKNYSESGIQFGSSKVKQSEKVMYICYNLMIVKEIKYDIVKTEVRGVIEIFPILGLLLDRENFDEGKFEEDWINIIPKQVLLELLIMDNLKSVILNSLSNKLNLIESKEDVLDKVGLVLKELSN